MMKNLPWKEQVKNLQVKYAKKKKRKIDLEKLLRDIHDKIKLAEAISRIFHENSSDTTIFKKLLKRERVSLKIFEKLTSKTKIDFIEHFKNKLILVEIIKQRIEQNKLHIKTKKYQKSIPFQYIQGLAGVYYTLTGEIPECIKRGEYYHGKFYDFLIEIKPLLAHKNIGVFLKDNATIGKYAYGIVKGYNPSREKIPRFKEILNFDILK